MTEQVSLWQEEKAQSGEFAELCCALYERELAILVQVQVSSAQAIQGRIKSLPYYIKRTANAMLQANSPLDLDIQNATWSSKQSSSMPLSGQDVEDVNAWYLKNTLTNGLVIPLAVDTHIVLDSIDRVDTENNRFRTNVYGWFNLSEDITSSKARLLKPNKRVMTAACTGHTWINSHKSNPTIPTLRELLLSCAIDWRNFKQPALINRD